MNILSVVVQEVVVASEEIRAKAKNGNSSLLHYGKISNLK